MLPLSIWIAGLCLLVLGAYLNLPERTGATNDTVLTNAGVLDVKSARFTDYFDAAWRSGSTRSPMLIEATYFFPELAAALESLPTKSGHQSEIADRVALAKANVNSLVFYVTLAGEGIDGLEAPELLSVSDSDGTRYQVQDWIEANASLLPASSVHQRIGLLVVDLQGNNGKTFTENDPDTLLLTVRGLTQDPQVLRWDLNLLANYLRDYGRNS